MVCKKCSATIVDGGIFCPMCGARADGNKVCPKCEKLISENSVFCSYCGTRVSEDVVVAKDIPTTENVTEEVAKADTPITESEQNTNNVANVAPVVVPVVVPVASATESIMPTSVLGATEDSVIENQDVCSEEDSEETPILEAIICSQCGSNDVELISEELGKCKNCGTQVVINKTKETNYVTNNVTIKMNGNGGDDSIGFFELPKEIDEKTFYANALTEIALDKNSPEDIFIIGKYEPVKTEYRQYALAKGTANMTYSATVGYDRKVEYKEYNSSSKSYVTKTKTVTDWQPFSGSYTGEYLEAVANDSNPDVFDPDDYKNYCLASSKEYDAISSKSPTPLAPTSSSISSLEIEIKSSARFDCKSKLPGDRNKDFNCDGFVTLSVVESHVAPQYILKYKYLYKDYTLKAHSCKKSKIRGDIPSAKSEIETEIEQNKLVKTFNYITLFTLLFSILSAIVFPVALKIVFAIIGVVSFITYWIIRSKVSKEIYFEKAFKKKQTLISHLKKKGIEVPKKLQGV